MKKKKIVKLLGPVAGIMSFMLLTGVFTTSAFADQVSTSSTAITQNSTKDYKKIINKSVEQNGVKVTLLDVVATKHKIKANIKLECSKGLQDEKKNGLFVQGIYNMQESWGGGQGTSNIDDNTLIVEIEDECEDNSEYKSNGDYRLDIVVPYYKVNIGMNIPVDFTSEFAKVKENEVSIYVKDLDVNIKKVESDILGTNIYYTQKSQNYSNSDFDNEVHDPIVLLKVGDKIYVANSYGGANWGSYNEDNDLEYRTYYSKDATYDKVTTTDAISIIPISNDITYNESNKFYDEKYKDGYEVNEEDYTTEQSVSFVKEFDFSDKSKGEIYKIERDNDIVKLYCKGNSKEKSLLMASTMDIYPKYDENEEYYYDEDYYKTIYKDKNADNGYVVEFTNVDKVRNMIVGIDALIQFSDRYKFGEEIKLK